VEVPTLAADGQVEAAIGAPPLDHKPLRDRPPQRASQVPRPQLWEALRQLTAAAEAIVGELDDGRDNLLRRRQF
jgi:hypothetical protein